MPPTPARTKPKRPNRRVTRVTLEHPTTDGAPRTERLHGDAYADVCEREGDLAGTTSSHGVRTDRRPEEPSERAVDDTDRLEGSL